MNTNDEKDARVRAAADLRREYRLADLDEAEVSADPLAQFELWFAEAVAADVNEPTAMTLATATADGEPSARMVLFKGLLDGGFTFYTNYESRKGIELAQNPRSALVFYWPELERQVRVNGTVTRLSRADSERYFRSRPVGSRLSAWASRQSAVVVSRADLDDSLRDVTSKYPDGDIPLPPFWGGLIVRPTTIEFWQGRVNRFHDRIRYTKQDGDTWRIERLAP